MDRRTFLRVAAGGAAATAATVASPLSPRAGAETVGPFRHGVASGDPLADRLVLWTRVTPSDAATPGSGVGPAVAVAWEVALDEGFTRPLASGTTTTGPERDHTVVVDVAGLPAGTEVWYRFRALGATSSVGRGRTAPAAGAPVDELRFGLVSCSNYEGGFFSAYRHLAERDDLDAVFHLGDYLYEYPVGGYGPAASLGRRHDPATEITTLEDYRRRHAQYKADPDLGALHRRYSWVITLDDHEVTNDSWADGAENHQPDEGSYAARKAASRQAWFEWMPVRRPAGDDPLRLYRGSAYGDLVDLFVLDERTYRSRQVDGVQGALFVTDPAVADPDRTMLGEAQRRWLEEGLAASAAPWKLVLNPVMFAPLVLTDLPDVPGATPVLDQVLGGLGVTLPVVVNGDQWDGYRAEQQALTATYAATGGVVVLTGDIHSSWAAEVPVDPGTYLAGSPTAAVEFVVPAVTSDAFSGAVADLGVPGAEQLGALLPTIVPTAGPWFKYLDADRQGYGVLRVTAAEVQHQWFHLVDRLDADSGAVPGPSYRSALGTDRLEAAGALPARAARPAAAPAPTPASPGPTLPATGGEGATGLALPAVAAGLAAAAVLRRSRLAAEGAGAVGASPTRRSSPPTAPAAPNATEGDPR